MKKTRFLALILAVVLMLMGAGYAFWTENLKIDATLKTGKLDFEFGSVEDATVKGSKHVIVSAKANNEDQHKLDLELENLYPGATAKVNFPINNTGTIDLKIEDFELIEDSELEGDNSNIGQLVILQGEDQYDIREYFLEQQEPIEIKVNKSKKIKLEFGVKGDANEDDFEEDAKFSFSITAKAKQFNAPVQEETE